MSKISDILSGGMIPMGADDESIEKESPLLHSIPKENPFSVPENYFDSLPSQIVVKCREEVVSKNTVSYISYLTSHYIWRLLAVTGCVAAICFFAIRVNLNNRPVSYEAMAKNIPDSLIVEHLDYSLTDVNISTLEDLQVPETNSSSVKNTSDSANTDQQIIAYLMNNNVSVSDIENEP